MFRSPGILSAEPAACFDFHSIAAHDPEASSKIPSEASMEDNFVACTSDIGSLALANAAGQSSDEVA